MQNLSKLFIIIVLAILTITMTSCGEVDRKNFIGNWTPDLASIDFHISEKAPGEITDNFDSQKVQAQLKKHQKKVDMVSMEFLEDGIFKFSSVGQILVFQWDIEGYNLTISGELPKEVGDEYAGKHFTLSFEILASTKDEFTIQLTGSSLRDQISSQFEKQYNEMMSQVGPMLGLLDFDAILADTWVSMKFNKKKTKV